jgi:hypothetical protein
MKTLLFALLILPLLALSGPAFAERRVALVIGNGAYQSVPALPNPADDAGAIAQQLKDTGFEVVLRTDLDQRSMASAVAEFSQKLQGAEVGLFYYAGHALQYSGQNYLVATNAELDNPFALNSDAIPLDQIVKEMESSAKVTLVLLDACRNNPFIDRLKQAMPDSRSVAVSRGLAPINVDAVDTMIAYATSANQTAADGAGEHSPFTQALLDNMMTPGLEVSLVMKRVVQQVRAATLRQQNPEVLSRMASEFYFVPGTKLASLGPDAADEYAEVNAAFKAAMTVGTVQVWRDFIAHYPDTSLSDYARQALRDAEAEEGVASVAPAAGVPRTNATSLPLGAIDVTEQPGSTDTASLPPLHFDEPEGTTDQSAQPATPTLSPEVLALQIQGELNRIGCNVGTPDGIWGTRSRQGLELYAKTASLDVATLDLTKLLLDKLRAVPADFCPITCTVTQELKDGQCVAKTCAAGQRLSSKGVCYKPATTTAATPPKKKKAPVVEQAPEKPHPVRTFDPEEPRSIVIEVPQSLCSLCT